MEKITFEKVRELHNQALQVGFEMVSCVEEEKAEALAEDLVDKLTYLSSLFLYRTFKDVTTNESEIKVLTRQAKVLLQMVSMIKEGKEKGSRSIE